MRLMRRDLSMTALRVRLGAAVLMSAAAADACGAEPVVPDLDRAASLVIALDAQLGERALQGAGVVVARERDAVTVVTAKHVVRQCQSANMLIVCANIAILTR